MASNTAQILKAAAAIGLWGAQATQAPKLMSALCDPRSDTDETSRLIRSDPALAARVIRVANSAFYQRSRSVATLERALVVLGLEAVRGIAAAVCMDRSMNNLSGPSCLDIAAVWNHSLTTAVACEALAQLTDPAMVAESFIGGLLHNLGVAVQIQIDLPGVRTMVNRRRQGDDRPMRELEQSCVAVGHEECAAVVFESWRLPESLIGAVAHHHEPDAAAPASRTLASIIHVGSQLALAGGSTFALEPTADRDVHALSELNLTEQELDELAALLPARAAMLHQACSTR